MELTEELLSTAYHEAGHAVACILQGWDFEFVTIEPGDDCLGMLHLGKFLTDEDYENIEYGDISLELKEKIEQSIIIDLAGGAAQKKATGQGDPSEQDISNASEFLIRLSGNSKEMNSYAEDLSCSAEALFTTCDGKDTFNWQLVNDIADALIKKSTLYYQEVLKIYSNFRERGTREQGQR